MRQKHRPSASLAMLATAGLLGAPFFAGDQEPQYKDQVKTEFDVERLEAAKRRRLNRRFKKQQQIAMSKGLPAPERPVEEARVETERADVVMVGSLHSESHLLARQISERRQLGPILIVDAPTPTPNLLEALRSLHQSGLL
jgi:hypothetical protein